ncbi:MAG: PAS domain S-box protein [Verrucomicrobia bacterium]|nr:PAS domain S-box protein [Verrucomicrobiota bacterium]
MNSSAFTTTSFSSSHVALQPALLMLDAAGIVRAASDAAGKFWQTDPASLVGQPVANLFVFEVTSQEAGWQEAQWEVLLASASNRPLPLQAQPFESAPVDVQLELQPAHGGPAAYFAQVRLAPAGVLPAGRPAFATGGESGPDLLAARGAPGFFDLDVATGGVWYSPGWKRLLGYAEDELANTYAAWLGLIHPEDTAAAPDRVGKRTGAGSRQFSVEFRLRHHLGHYVWIQCTGVQLFNADDTLQRVLGLHLDITERKEIEEQGFANEDRLRRLSDEGRLGLFDLDFSIGSHWFSASCQPLLGDKAGTTSPDTFLQALPETAATGGLAHFFATAPGEPFFMQLLNLHTADGAQSVAVGAHRQWTRKRELIRVVGFVLPLPAGSGDGPVPASVLPDLLASLGEGVILTDARSQILHLNPKAERLTGWSLTDARQSKLGDIFKLVRRENGRPDDTAVDLVLATEEKPRLYSEHALVAASSGAPSPIIWTARQVRDAQGATAGVVVVFRDPQEMSLSPEEIVRANRFESLGQLAGGIAHDFNNLLTTILGGISQAKDNRDYSKLNDAESACLAAKSLTRQLLTFSKGSAASQQVVATADILNDAVRIAAAGTTAVVTVEAAADTAPVLVDRGQILQVFQNLIINALQAMADPSKGRVQLRAANVTLADGEVPPLPAGPYVQIEVQDNGSGISKEHLEKIFEPFFTTKKQGTGLGLATVFSIVRKHGGQIGVDSTIGTGTTFTVFFPHANRPVEAPVRRAPALRFGTGRVLFMDDDPKICDLTAGMLTSLDYTYDIVKNGEDALTFYRRYLNIGRPYDVVIMDLTIVGGMGGEDCFKALHALHPEVRAIVSSGYDSEEMAQRYLDMGFAGYLTKPYRAAELGKVIKTALG